MKQCYLDNASTTYPKPKEVADAVYNYMTNLGCNVNRGGYQKSYAAADLVYETREFLCELFDAEDCKNVVFTKNATESINILLKGFLKPGDHILLSSMEHNSVMRPLNQLFEHDITYAFIPCESDGSICLEAIEPLILPKTKAIICMHASNVSGTIMPIKEIGAICQKHHLRFFVDSAQTAGILPISMKEMKIDALIFTGHKGLLGPQGIGGLILKEDMIPLVTPLLSGGSGSFSHTADIPPVMPDRFEAGTLNLPGIAGLHASLNWLKQTGIDTIYQHEMALTDAFLTQLKRLEQDGFITIIGKKDTKDRLGVISIQTNEIDIANVAYQLDESYGIQTRVGLHCAPVAQKIVGAYPTGTLRFSFGYWNTEEDVNYTIQALENICHGI